MSQTQTNSAPTAQKPPFSIFTKCQTIYYELKPDRRRRTGNYCCEGSNRIYNPTKGFVGIAL
jgi:hypothetical protein